MFNEKDLNATTTSDKSDKSDQNMKAFLEIYYIQRYKEFVGDLQALDFELGKSDKSWNLGKIIESLLSVMMLTGADTMFYRTLFGRVAMFSIAAFGSLLVTLVLASCSSLTIVGINKCFEIFSLCKKSKSKEKSYDKNYLATDVTIDFGTLIIVTVCCAGSILLGAMAMQNDQPTWSIADATLYTFAQATTLGNSQFIPDRTALSQQTFYSIYFYASIRIFTMYWITCFALAIFKLSENLDKIARSGLSTLDMEDILLVDRARMRRQKFVRYMN
uniref:Uncharacterized protein n=1 Tax=Panagrolaimus sp. ES5 TaxID=591445 RepID=A0AC34GX39_9BILA